MNDETELLYIRFYERMDETREMITKKYYDLNEDLPGKKPAYYDEKLGDVWPLGVLLDDIASAADRK